MSVINFTLFVQMLHFFIAFLLIKYFFFKLAVAHIQAEDNFQDILISTVQQHQATVIQKEKDIIEHWTHMQEYFAAHAPSIKKEPEYSSKTPPLIHPTFNQDQVAEEITQLADVVQKRIDDVW